MLFRFQDRYPVSRSTRARWLKDPLLPEPDLIAGGVCFWSEEKLEHFDRLRTARERAERTVKPLPGTKKETAPAMEPPAPTKRKRGRPSLREFREGT